MRIYNFNSRTVIFLAILAIPALVLPGGCGTQEKKQADGIPTVE